MENNHENRRKSCTNLHPKDWKHSDIMKWMEENKGLMIKTGYPYVNNHSVYLSWDDVQQEAYFTVLKAQKKYDSSKEASFHTYVCRSLENNLKLIIRKENAKKRTPENGKGILSLSDDRYDCPLEVQESYDSIADREDLIYTEELLKNIRAIGEEMCTEEEKTMLNMWIHSFYAGTKTTQQEMATRMNCSQATISKKRKELLGKLMEELKVRSFSV